MPWIVEEVAGAACGVDCSCKYMVANLISIHFTVFFIFGANCRNLLSSQFFNCANVGRLIRSASRGANTEFTGLTHTHMMTDKYALM